MMQAILYLTVSGSIYGTDLTQRRTHEGNAREQLLAITRVSWVLYRVKSRVLTRARVASARR